MSERDETLDRSVERTIARLDETLNALGYSFVLTLVERDTGRPCRLACRGTDAEIIMCLHECDCFWRSLRVTEITRFREERAAMAAEMVASKKEDPDD